MIPLINLAAAAVTAVLTISSGKNMLQTVSLSRQHTPTTLPLQQLDHINDSSTVISHVQSLNRNQLLQLYFHQSRSPRNLKEVEGEWDGCLLDNNSRIMTGVTAFLTNSLFGKGRTWNGKQFGTTSNPQLGVNRFTPSTKQQKSSSPINKKSSSSGSCETEHTFDMRLQPSKFFNNRRSRRDGTTSTENDNNNNNNSLVLDYTNHQSPLSLWRTMMDEIRIVPLGNTGDGEEDAPRVLIGLGYMAWSGGRLNASPFLLFRRPTTTTPPKV